MKFKVVDIKTGDRWGNVSMDYYLGVTLTVRDTQSHSDFVFAKENAWAWYNHMIDWDKTLELNGVTLVDILESGMIVQLRNDERFLVIKNTNELYLISQYGIVNGKNYTSDLLYHNPDMPDMDVIEIFKPEPNTLLIMSSTKSNSVWKRTSKTKEQVRIEELKEDILKLSEELLILTRGGK